MRLGLVWTLAAALGVACDAPIPVAQDGVDGGALRQDGGARMDGGPRDGSRQDGGVPDDASAPCDASTCWPIPPQCGCPDGLACYNTVPSLRVCLTPGPGQRGEPCSAVDAQDPPDCGAGLACFEGRTSTDVGTCTPYCDSSSECMSGVCWGTANVGICSLPCEPLGDGSACPGEQRCYITGAPRLEDGERTLSTVCAIPTNLGVGESCSFLCEPGLMCVGDVCRELCVIGEGNCSSGSCRRLDPAAVIRGTEYGVCA